VERDRIDAAAERLPTTVLAGIDLFAATAAAKLFTGALWLALEAAFGRR